FPAGSTVVTCTATDDAGNQATRSFTVTVAPLIGYVIAIGGTTANPGSAPVTMPIGSAATVTVGEYAPNTPVKGIMHSTPTALGSTRADTSGRVSFTFTMPAVGPGRHHLELTGIGPTGGAVQVVIPFEVPEAAGSTTTTTTTTTTAPTTTAVPGGALPRTGSGHGSVVLLALALIAIGAACLVTRRRPHRTATGIR
ncbi:MAG TPA: HYR domain-containing protein, partial [Ilumatobacteraceae bacterium]|nr:HYR domain-containing protein [Ilumatobacteraceae bacterium]